MLKSSLPENIRDQFHISGDHILLNGLHADSANDVVREAAYKIYYFHNADQEWWIRRSLQGEPPPMRHWLGCL